tara:strand:- start:846 stop:1103 length:258 start_codon:yes stop_codon:yes gene_type:complete
MKAIGKYIIINKIEEQITTESGLLLSSEDVSDLRYHKGEVVQPGTEVDAIKSGDIIYYDKSRGHSMMINNKEYSIIVEKDVVVVE